MSQKPLYVGMCLQCVRCRWVGWKAKTKTASNQSKNLTKFSEIKKIRKKRFNRSILQVEVNFYLQYLLAYLKDELKIWIVPNQARSLHHRRTISHKNKTQNRFISIILCNKIINVSYWNLQFLSVISTFIYFR